MSLEEVSFYFSTAHKFQGSQQSLKETLQGDPRVPCHASLLSSLMNLKNKLRLLTAIQKG
jgi:hypothetical protein